MRSSPPTRDVVEGDLVLGVRGEGELLGQSRRPPRRVDQEQVDGLGGVAGAGQHDQPVGRRGEGHVALERR